MEAMAALSPLDMLSKATYLKRDVIIHLILFSFQDPKQKSQLDFFFLTQPRQITITITSWFFIGQLTFYLSVTKPDYYRVYITLDN